MCTGSRYSCRRGTEVIEDSYKQTQINANTVVLMLGYSEVNILPDKDEFRQTYKQIQLKFHTPVIRESCFFAQTFSRYS